MDALLGLEANATATGAGAMMPASVAASAALQAGRCSLASGSPEPAPAAGPLQASPAAASPHNPWPVPAATSSGCTSRASATGELLLSPLVALQVVRPHHHSTSACIPVSVRVAHRGEFPLVKGLKEPTVPRGRHVPLLPALQPGLFCPPPQLSRVCRQSASPRCGCQ